MSEKSKQPPKANAIPKARLHMPPDLDPVYANMVRIAHTPAEVVIDFSAMLPADRVGKVVSRVVMSPMGAKLFAKAMEENVAKFEAAFGEINIPKRQSLADFLFNPPAAPDEDDPTKETPTKDDNDSPPPKE